MSDFDSFVDKDEDLSDLEKEFLKNTNKIIDQFEAEVKPLLIEAGDALCKAMEVSDKYG